LNHPTIKDVARVAGVAPSTVSSVLNDKGTVASATRARIVAAIEELGYAPNQSARNLKRSRVALIGLVVPDLQNEFFALVGEGVQDTAHDRDVLVVLCSTDANAEREAYYARLLRSRRLDGVIYLSGTGISPGALVELAAVEAVVFVDEKLPGLQLPFVGSDNRAGARAAADHLLSEGHERVAIIGGPPALWTSEQRLAGYREALAAAGRDPDAAPLVTGDYRQASGRAGAERLLRLPDRERPTAILCANDLMAMGVIQLCRERGVKIPEQLSVVGFDDVPSSALLAPPLTTVRQQSREMGRRAAALLLSCLDGEPGGDAGALLATELVMRESVAPPA
jgi:DNA-binding LacI/PurR family transcriptional regulator